MRKGCGSNIIQCCMLVCEKLKLQAYLHKEEKELSLDLMVCSCVRHDRQDMGSRYAWGIAAEGLQLGKFLQSVF